MTVKRRFSNLRFGSNTDWKVTALRRMAIATLTLAIPMTAVVSPGLAQAVTEADADEWFEEAEALDEQGGDLDETVAAYERALDAYRSLDDQSNSLKVLEDLFALTYRACQYEQAIAWAEQALELFPAPETSTNPTDDANHHRSWTETLGRVYRQQGQMEQAIATYEAGLQFLENLPPSTRTDSRVDLEADLLRELLVTHSIADSEALVEMEVLQQRLVETSQRAGVMRQLERLLSDARWMNRPGRSPELLRYILDMSRQYGYASGELQALMMLGKEAWHRGELEAAIAQGEAALALAEPLAENDTYVITIAASLARLYEESGQVEQVARLQQAYEGITVSGDRAIHLLEPPERFSPLRLLPLSLRIPPPLTQCGSVPALPTLQRPPEPEPIPY